MKKLLIIIIAAITVFNTLLGAMIDSYEVETCIHVGLSLVLTTGLLYWLYVSQIAEALKITITFIFILTGIIRVVLMLLGTSNGIFLAFIGILLLEAVIMAIAYYNTLK